MAAAELQLQLVSVADPAATALLDSYSAELLDRKVEREPDRTETVVEEYDCPAGAFVVAYEADEPIACGGIRDLGGGIAEIKRMYVAPDARGRGVGAALLQRLEDEARQRGYERLRLDTAAALTAAQALYRKAGFREIGDYNGNTAAAHWFEKELVAREGGVTARQTADGPSPRLVWLALGLIYLIWGSTYLGIRVMVETVPPLVGSGLRFLIAGAIFYAVLWARNGTSAVRFTRANLLATTGAGCLLCFGGNGLVTVAEQDVPSGIAATLIASVPLWIILFRRVSHERINRISLLGVLIGFAGVGVLMLPGERPAGVPLSGMLVLLLAASLWAIGSYYPRRWPLPHDVMLSTALQMLTSGLVMLVVGAIAGEFGDVHPGEISTRSVAGFVWLVTAGSLVGYTSYVWLLKNAPISKVSTYAYVNPVIAVFLGALVLDEQITSTIVVGGALIVASVALVVSRETG